MLDYSSIKTSWSESFGMKKPVWHHQNLESTQWSFDWKHGWWGHSAICRRPVEGFDHLQFAETPFSAGSSIGAI